MWYRKFMQINGITEITATVNRPFFLSPPKPKPAKGRFGIVTGLQQAMAIG